MTVRARRPATVLLLAALALSGCARRKAGVTLAGSTSVQPFAEKWVEVYHQSHPDFDALVQGGGSTAGVVAAETGTAQIGMCSRDLKKDEAAKLRAIVVARDAMVLIVHPDNPLSDIRLDQVKEIYTAEIRRWSELGGPDKRITVITREEGSGTRGAFEEMVMHKARIHHSALVQDSMGAVRQMVSADVAGIGYISLGIVDPSVKQLRLDGVEASEENVDNGSYPLVRPFLFLVKGEPPEAARPFVDWVLGPEGREVTRREGLLPPRS